jgi:hypothetical protein
MKMTKITQTIFYDNLLSLEPIMDSKLIDQLRSINNFYSILFILIILILATSLILDLTGIFTADDSSKDREISAASEAELQQIALQAVARLREPEDPLYDKVYRISKSPYANLPIDDPETERNTPDELRLNTNERFEFGMRLSNLSSREYMTANVVITSPPPGYNTEIQGPYKSWPRMTLVDRSLLEKKDKGKPRIQITRDRQITPNSKILDDLYKTSPRVGPRIR